jgi:gliding motility-associated-like protein
MMKSLFLWLTGCALSILTIGQNLIPNAGFESNSGLPSTTGEWDLVDDWDNCGSSLSSPDYFHLNGSLGGDLPETPIGEVYPYEGEAVMGITFTGRRGENYREYISVALSSPLTVGQKYRLSFQITNGKLSSTTNAGLAISGIGTLFSTNVPVQTANEPINLSPQQELEGVLFTDDWYTFNYTFIADQAYTHLTVGAFRDDNSRLIEDELGTDPALAYYFVDAFELREYEVEDGITELENPSSRNDEIDVEVEGDAFGDFYIPNAFSPDNDGINDFFKPTSLEKIPFQMKIYNKWGELVYEMDESDMGWDGSDVSRNKTSQCYIWQLVYEKAINNGDREERILEGSLTVVR